MKSRSLVWEWASEFQKMEICFSTGVLWDAFLNVAFPYLQSSDADRSKRLINAIFAQLEDMKAAAEQLPPSNSYVHVLQRRLERLR